MARVLGHLRETGEFPSDFKSNEHLRSEYECNLTDAQRSEWSGRFHACLLYTSDAADE